MIGFPDFILDPKKLDEKYEGVSGLLLLVSTRIFSALFHYSLLYPPDTHTRIWSRENVESNRIKSHSNEMEKKVFQISIQNTLFSVRFDEMFVWNGHRLQENKISLHFPAWNFQFFLFFQSFLFFQLFLLWDWEMETNCQWDSGRKITWTGISYVYLRYNL